MTQMKPRPNEEPAASPAPPAREPEAIQPAHPVRHQHPHAVIHPVETGVSHTDPGGTVHI